MRRIFISFIAAAMALVGSINFSIECKAQLASSGTYMFAERDSIKLFMDEFKPAANSITNIDGKEKPTIIFVFGGGFKNGERDNATYNPWFKALTEEGYHIFTIDYRLGMKGQTKGGLGQVGLFYKSIEMAVEDLFAATNYIINHAEALGINPDNIVICGSSAGAMTVLQAEWHRCNGDEIAKVLPENFKYTGVISFAGAILSRHGALKYKTEPAPTLLMHGTADAVVNYGKMRFFNWGFYGSDFLAKYYKKHNFNYVILRYVDHGHDIANSFMTTFKDQIDFLEVNVTKGITRVADSTIDDPRVIKLKASRNRKELYGK